MGSIDDEILHSLGIQPPRYDFSTFSIKEMARCMEDYAVTLDEKMEVLINYSYAAQRIPMLENALTPDLIRDAIRAAVVSSIGTSPKEQRIKTYKLACNEYKDQTTQDIYCHLRDFAQATR